MVRDRIAALFMVLSGTMFVGCSGFQPVTSGTEDTCATLDNIVTDYSTGFADVRGSSSNFSSGTIYQAKAPLIKGHCEIWAWGNGEAAYTCNVAAPDKAIAETLYSRASEQLSQCLGSEWRTQKSMRDRDGRPAGERIRFSRNDGVVPAVSLNRVEDRSRHSIYLYIGPTSRSPE